jgi:hypothetical protein
MTTPKRNGSPTDNTDGSQFQNDLAFLYFWRHLDFLNDLAYEIALDFYARPQTWQNADDIADNLDNLRSKYGTEPEFPSTDQRSAVLGALFGPDFSNSLQKLMDATSALQEFAFFDGALGGLRGNFLQAATDFQAYLNGLNGSPVRKAKSNLFAFTELVYAIFRNQNVDRVYGYAQISQQFPYVLDTNANNLVAAISNQIGSQQHTASEVYNHQRAGLNGGTAIDGVFAFNPTDTSDKNIDGLARLVYNWLSALRALGTQPSLGAQPITPNARALMPAPMAVASYRR